MSPADPSPMEFEFDGIRFVVTVEPDPDGTGWWLLLVDGHSHARYPTEERARKDQLFTVETKGMVDRRGGGG